MSAWLYQLASKWKPEQYRLNVWEGKKTKWYTHEIANAPVQRIARGDLILFYFCETDNIDPGIYGWGVIQSISVKNELITFIPATPSDYLKMFPCRNGVKGVINGIRGRFAAKTMWRMSYEDLKQFRTLIAAHINTTDMPTASQPLQINWHSDQREDDPDEYLELIHNKNGRQTAFLTGWSRYLNFGEYGKDVLHWQTIGAYYASVLGDLKRSQKRQLYYAALAQFVYSQRCSHWTDDQRTGALDIALKLQSSDTSS